MARDRTETWAIEGGKSETEYSSIWRTPHNVAVRLYAHRQMNKIEEKKIKEESKCHHSRCDCGNGGHTSMGLRRQRAHPNQLHYIHRPSVHSRFGTARHGRPPNELYNYVFGIAGELWLLFFHFFHADLPSVCRVEAEGKRRVAAAHIREQIGKFKLNNRI